MPSRMIVVIPSVLTEERIKWITNMKRPHDGGINHNYIIGLTKRVNKGTL